MIENEAQTDETASVLDLRERFKGLDDLLKEVAGKQFFVCSVLLFCSKSSEFLPGWLR